MGHETGTSTPAASDAPPPPSAVPPGLPRCPACAAVVRAGAPWCTQCYLDLRAPAPGPAVVPPAVVLPDVVPPAAAPPAAGPGGGPTWPCTSCGSGNALASDVCAACDSPFLADLRAGAAPLLVLPGVGDVAALSRAGRLGLAGGAVLAVAAVVLALGLL